MLGLASFLPSSSHLGNLTAHRFVFIFMACKAVAPVCVPVTMMESPLNQFLKAAPPSVRGTKVQDRLSPHLRHGSREPVLGPPQECVSWPP